MIDTV